MSLFGQSPFGDGTPEPIPAEEFRVLDKLALKVVEWRMAPVAIMTLESFKPMNYVGSQGMIFLGPVFEPLLEMFFKYRDYDILRQAMERRQNVENVIQMIERYDAYAAAYDRKVKKLIKEQKKQWKWYQRWLGINQPKIEPPAELKDFDWRAAGQKENREVFLKSAESNENRDGAN